MRIVSLVFAMLAGLTLASCVVTDGGTGRLAEQPYCAFTNVQGDWQSNCYLPSFEACRQEVLGGNRGYCGPNPNWVPPAPPPQARR